MKKKLKLWRKSLKPNNTWTLARERCRRHLCSLLPAGRKPQTTTVRSKFWHNQRGRLCPWVLLLIPSRQAPTCLAVGESPSVPMLCAKRDEQVFPYDPPLSLSSSLSLSIILTGDSSTYPVICNQLGTPYHEMSTLF